MRNTCVYQLQKFTLCLYIIIKYTIRNVNDLENSLYFLPSSIAFLWRMESSVLDIIGKFNLHVFHILLTSFMVGLVWVLQDEYFIFDGFFIEAHHIMNAIHLFRFHWLLCISFTLINSIVILFRLSLIGIFREYFHLKKVVSIFTSTMSIFILVFFLEPLL